MELSESIILSALYSNEDYVRRTLPYLEKDYFTSEPNKVIFELIRSHVEKYNTTPTKDSLMISLDDVSLSENNFKESHALIESLKETDDKQTDWQVDHTERWCQERALYNAVMKSISILNDHEDQKGDLPKLLQDALAVSFDTHIGHDFVDDFETRFEFYNRVEEKVPFHLELFNEITKGGLSNKTLNVALAGTGVGKSLFMCDLAANHYMMGKNVLYITLEMSEEKIAERIDANLLNISIADVASTSKSSFEKKIEKIKNKTTGKLIIK